MIIHQEGPGGGRLAYYGERADQEHWDSLWDAHFAVESYRRARRGHLPHQLRATFRRWVEPGARVLEAGCGLGHFTVAARALGYRAEGVDYAPRVVERLRALFPDIPFFQGDVRHLHVIADGTYDAVYSPGVCEHFEEGPGEVLRETYRILKPGGIALVSHPCCNALRRRLARRGRFAGRPEGEFYQYAFSEREIAGELQAIGFEILQAHLSGTLKTLSDHYPLVARIPLGPLRTPLAYALDVVPPFRSYGHGVITVARKGGA